MKTTVILLTVPALFSATIANAQLLVWDQDFSVDDTGWFDSDNSWFGNITVSGGAAIFEGSGGTGPFSRFDGYRDTWEGTWIAEIDVYLDPAALAPGEGFDYSVAASGSDGNHQRDYIFHVSKDTSSGSLLVAGSNNTNFATREDLDNLANNHEVTAAGWYTLQHVFYEDSGALAVDLNLLDGGGATLFTETRFTAADTIPGEVGGNRYSWFTHISVAGGIAVDNHQLYFGLGLVIDGCVVGIPDLVVDTEGGRLSDYIAACADEAGNHGQFVSCVAQLVRGLVVDGILTQDQGVAIVSCAAQSNLP